MSDGAAVRAIAVRKGVKLEIEGYDIKKQKLIMNGQRRQISLETSRQIANAAQKFGVDFELRE